MSRIRKFFISPNPFLCQQVRIGSAKTRWTILIVYIYHKLIFGGQLNQIMHPDCPSWVAYCTKPNFKPTSPTPYIEEIMFLRVSVKRADLHIARHLFPVSYHMQSLSQINRCRNTARICMKCSGIPIPSSIKQNILEVVFHTKINALNGIFSC